MTAGAHSIAWKATEDRVTRFRQSQPDFSFDFGERLGQHNPGPFPRNRDKALDALARYARARGRINATDPGGRLHAPLPHDRVNATPSADQLTVMGTEA